MTRVPSCDVVRHTPSSIVTDPPLTSPTITPTSGIRMTRSNSQSFWSSVRRRFATMVQSSGACATSRSHTSRSDSVENWGCRGSSRVVMRDRWAQRPATPIRDRPTVRHTHRTARSSCQARRGIHPAPRQDRAGRPGTRSESPVVRHFHRQGTSCHPGRWTSHRSCSSRCQRAPTLTGRLANPTIGAAGPPQRFRIPMPVRGRRTTRTEVRPFGRPSPISYPSCFDGRASSALRAATRCGLGMAFGSAAQISCSA